MKKSKNFTYYSNLNYPVTILEKIDNKTTYFEAEIPDLTGCRASGKTIEEALKNLEEAKNVWLKFSLKKNLRIPEPESEDEYSGRILLRIPAKLHMTLSKRAKKEGLSLNQYMRRNLEQNINFSDLIERMDAIENEIKLLKSRGPIAEELSVTVDNAEVYRGPWTAVYTNTSDNHVLAAENFMAMMQEKEREALGIYTWEE
jgi:antitoxin HicB